MFKSQLTGRQYGPGIKSKRVVIATRPRTYTNLVVKDHRHSYVTSHGTEIVAEMVIGPFEIMPSDPNQGEPYGHAPDSDPRL